MLPAPFRAAQRRKNGTFSGLGLRHAAQGTASSSRSFLFPCSPLPPLPPQAVPGGPVSDGRTTSMRGGSSDVKYRARRRCRGNPNPSPRRTPAGAFSFAGERAMSTIEPSEFIPALASPREDVGRYARQLLGIPADAELLPRLVGWLTGDSPAIRASAATGLGRLADEAAELPLLEALGDPAPEVRAAAAHALGAIMPQGYAPSLPR